MGYCSPTEHHGLWYLETFVPRRPFASPGHTARVPGKSLSTFLTRFDARHDSLGWRERLLERLFLPESAFMSCKCSAAPELSGLIPFPWSAPAHSRWIGSQPMMCVFSSVPLGCRTSSRTCTGVGLHNAATWYRSE